MVEFVCVWLAMMLNCALQYSDITETNIGEITQVFVRQIC